MKGLRSLETMDSKVLNFSTFKVSTANVQSDAILLFFDYFVDSSNNAVHFNRYGIHSIRKFL